MKQYINLIRKITWSFHQTTGIEWDELFSEASLAYCEALISYNPTKKSKESTWVYSCIQNKLKNFVKYELRNKSIPSGVSEWNQIHSNGPYFELFESSSFVNVSKSTESIIRMVVSTPRRYLEGCTSNRQTIGRIRRDLFLIKKWNHPQVEQAMRVLRTELSV